MEKEKIVDRIIEEYYRLEERTPISSSVKKMKEIFMSTKADINLLAERLSEIEQLTVEEYNLLKAS